MMSEPAKEPRLEGQRVAFLGKLAGMNRREAARIVAQHGGTVLESADSSATLVVVGEEGLPIANLAEGDVLDRSILEAADQKKISIITETDLWERLGFVEPDRQLYTPAMLADLLDVPLAIIRRWHRKGLIVPAREVKRLPYFDFQEVATARRLAELLAAGCSPHVIERKLSDLCRYVTGIERPLSQLSVIVEGKQLLLRQGDGLVEPGGQMRLDFESNPTVDSETAPESIAIPRLAPDPIAPEGMARLAAELEDEGRLEEAIEMYRATLVAGGPNAEVNFALAELLYRIGDLTAARERYFGAIELDEDYVEARANLGCVLAETSQYELAVAAFEGTLAHHDDYPDAHYHLARTLDELDRREEARDHWESFLRLAPDSPWAEEGRRRLTD